MRWHIEQVSEGNSTCQNNLMVANLLMFTADLPFRKWRRQAALYEFMPSRSKPGRLIFAALQRWLQCPLPATHHLRKPLISTRVFWSIKHRRTGWWNTQSIARCLSCIPGSYNAIPWFETNWLPDVQFPSPHRAGRLSHITFKHKAQITSCWDLLIVYKFLWLQRA